MEARILTDIPFSPDVDEFLKAVHVDAGSSEAVEVADLVKQAVEIARPKGTFGVAFIESRGSEKVAIDGVAFRSRVLAVNLQKVYRVFPYVATCGVELEEWSNRMEDPLQAYWADALKHLALGRAIRAVNTNIGEQFDPGPTSVMNPGSLPDWPLEQQRELLSLLGDVRSRVGVELTDSFLMIPTKSVSGLKFSTEVQFINCQLCPRERCEGRRAAYDPELYATRYAQR
jgi:hypothetical protein